jgi:large subunit ribosomal protein L15
MPKLGGFKNRNRVEYAVVNVGRLEELYAAGETVDPDTLFAHGVTKSKTTPVKVLGDGELTKALTVKVDKVSAPARAKIEAAGGTVDLT